MVDTLSGVPGTVQVSEIPGQGHWFDGIVDDTIMQTFFNTHFSYNLPSLPNTFTVVTLNPASSDGKFSWFSKLLK